MKYFGISLVLTALITSAIAKSETEGYNSTTTLAPKATAAPKTTVAPEKNSQVLRQRRCYSSQFECASGQCISSNLLCDGRQDCKDGSDESFSICFVPGGRRATTTTERNFGDHGRFSCTDEKFLCTSGECINRDYTCNGKRDCRDGSDELSTICHLVPESIVDDNIAQACLASEFQCKSGECIFGGFRCDGQVQCSDGSDEDWSICQTVAVEKPQTTTRRPANGGVIPLSQKDGTVNTGNNGGTGGKAWRSLLTPCNVPLQPSNGRWRLHRSLCNSNIECNPPSNIRTMDPGTYLVYNCNRGFVLNGTSDVLCGPGGKWIYEPSCDEVKCHDLSSSAIEALCMWNNVAVSCEISAPIGTTAELRCRKGFVQEVTYEQTYKNVKCQPDGTWSPKPIQCVKKPKKIKLVVSGDMIIED